MLGDPWELHLHPHGGSHSVPRAAGCRPTDIFSNPWTILPQRRLTAEATVGYWPNAARQTDTGMTAQPANRRCWIRVRTGAAKLLRTGSWRNISPINCKLLFFRTVFGTPGRTRTFNPRLSLPATAFAASTHRVCGLDYLFTVSGAARIVSTEPCAGCLPGSGPPTLTLSLRRFRVDWFARPQVSTGLPSA